MTPDQLNIIGSPIFQYGFAGMCVILLGMIIWLIKLMVDLFRDVINTLNANSEALRNNNKLYDSLMQIMIDIKDNLLKRPCLAENINKVKL